MITPSLIDWAIGKLADTSLQHLAENRQLRNQLDKAVKSWTKSLPKGQYVDPKALFPDVDPSRDKSERPCYYELQQVLIRPGLPSQDLWHSVFMESWHCAGRLYTEPQPFFTIPKDQASKSLKGLAEDVYGVCKQNESIFKSHVIDKLNEIVNMLR